MANKKANGKPKKIARQDDLPGMEDREIKALHEIAIDYAELRDERQDVGRREVELKTKLIDLMHAHKKTEYSYNNVSVKLIVEKEKIQVRVKKESLDEADVPKAKVSSASVSA